MTPHGIVHRFSFAVLAIIGVQGLGVSLVISETLWVDDDDPNCGGNLPCYQTVQVAIRAATENEIIGTAYSGQSIPLLDVFFPPAGIMIQFGKPVLQANQILDNRIGVLLQQEAEPLFRGNRIRKNGVGIALYRKPCFETVIALEFNGKLQGESNEVRENQVSDICPKDYPLPTGFLKT